VKYHATFIDMNYIHIVMEVCKGGELFSKLEQLGKFAEEDAALILKQCLQAVKHLHQNGVCHRDLKPENIMFQSEDSKEIKIIDFGLSKRFDGAAMQSVVGTPYYVAPEILSQEYDYRCDIWSLGIIFYILLCGYPPFNGKTSREVLAQIRRGRVVFDVEEWKDISKEAKDLIKKMLVVNVA